MPNDFEARAGRAFTMDCGEEGAIASVVKEIVPGKKLVYTFTSGKIGIETTVTITLASAEGRTRLTLVHSGWKDLPPSDRDLAETFDTGWIERLDRLQRQAVDD
jgi:uncharacterized protein YndB with AHSA1/START domain